MLRYRQFYDKGTHLQWNFQCQQLQSSIVYVSFTKQWSGEGEVNVWTQKTWGGMFWMGDLCQ